jgi:hypothetical protein
MRKLIAAAAVTLSLCLPALAEETACNQSRAKSLEEARAVAADIKAEVIEINDAGLAQRVADTMFDALSKPRRPVASLIILKARGGAMAALYGPDQCFVVGVRLPLQMLYEMVGRSA